MPHFATCLYLFSGKLCMRSGHSGSCIGRERPVLAVTLLYWPVTHLHWPVSHLYWPVTHLHWPGTYLCWPVTHAALYLCACTVCQIACECLLILCIDPVCLLPEEHCSPCQRECYATTPAKRSSKMIIQTAWLYNQLVKQLRVEVNYLHQHLLM